MRIMKVRASRVRRAAAKNGVVKPKSKVDNEQFVRRQLKNKYDSLVLEL